MIKEAEESQQQAKRGNSWRERSPLSNRRDQRHGREEDSSYDSKSRFKKTDNEQSDYHRDKYSERRNSRFIRPSDDNQSPDREKRREIQREEDKHGRDDYSRSRFVRPKDDHSSRSPDSDRISSYDSNKHRDRDSDSRHFSKRSSFVKPRDDRSSSSPERDNRKKYSSNKDTGDSERRYDDRKSGSRSVFARPPSDDESRNNSEISKKSRFMRPGEDRSSQSPDRRRRRSSRSPDRRGDRHHRDGKREEAPRWKKKQKSRSPTPEARKTKRKPSGRMTHLIWKRDNIFTMKLKDNRSL